MSNNISSNSEYENYYDILEIDKNADKNTIKKSYRRLAFKYHPDRNPHDLKNSEAQFKKLTEAYEVLSQSDKRRIYDQFGKNGLDAEGFNFADISPLDIFEKLFTGDNTFKNGPPGIVFMTEHNAIDPFSSLTGNSPLDELVNIGKMGPFGALSSAMGTMGGLGINIQGGIGVKTTRNNNFRTKTLIKNVTCNLQDIYSGSEKVIQIEPLMTIEGRLEKVTRHITIQIPKGVSNGEKITIPKSGNQSLQGEVGNLDIIIDIDIHPIFTRDGDDLQIERSILLSEAICGYEFVLRHLDGNKYLINQNNIIDNNTIHVIRNKGLPYRGNTKCYGDLYITYKIEFPKNLREDRILLLKKILPVRNSLPEKVKSLTRLAISEVDIESDDEELIDMTKQQQNSKGNREMPSFGGGFDFGMNLGGNNNNNSEKDRPAPCIQQ